MFLQIFFGYCALMIIVSGILAISLRNPVHCVLMVLVLFFHMAGLYLTLNAEFLGRGADHRLCRGHSGALSFCPLSGQSARGIASRRLYFQRLDGQDYRCRPGLGAGVRDPRFHPGGEGRLVDRRHQGTDPYQGHWGRKCIPPTCCPFEIAGLILLVALIGGLVLARRDEGKIEETGAKSDQQPGRHQTARR